MDFDASDADVEHVALRAQENNYERDVVLLFATLPEPGALASAAASALALSALAGLGRRRKAAEKRAEISGDLSRPSGSNASRTAKARSSSACAMRRAALS